MAKTLIASSFSFLVVVFAAAGIQAAEMKDLSADATLLVNDEDAAEYNADKAFLLKDGDRTGDFKDSFAFHTSGAGDSSIVITLKNTAEIRRMTIENRTDCCQDRANTLTVWLSADQKEWKEAWKADKGEASWSIELAKPMKAKFVKIGLREAQPLHLNKVRIYGNYTTRKN